MSGDRPTSADSEGVTSAAMGAFQSRPLGLIRTDIIMKLLALQVLPVSDRIANYSGWTQLAHHRTDHASSKKLLAPPM